ncbi:gamma carbonic anhydrase family protein [Aeromicrobium sp. 9AM]|uniref:gamma carbonic anhydrase family protein n=1 Tax=Aeromicrobium sp. 9AM TaxID=2653126 RepID=UPI0012F1FD42|nr:gamma carbonic anhydrase family protein [Aeromicrobium sp. 9AM]VXC39904.1 Transferase [Aeromicrobium sp. 9AM]
MLIEHRGASPRIDPTAYVAPTAVISGDVTIGADARILHGAVVTAEDGSVSIGARVVVMEHALVRGRASHPVSIGDDVLIGPHAHVNGATIATEVFIATGASLFPGSSVETGSEMRINSVLQVNSHIGSGESLPIGWVAVGDPAQMFSPDRHDEIWAIQRELDFGGTVYGVGKGAGMRDIMTRQAEFFGAHRDDRVIEP